MVELLQHQFHQKGLGGGPQNLKFVEHYTLSAVDRNTARWMKATLLLLRGRAISKTVPALPIFCFHRYRATNRL